MELLQIFGGKVDEDLNSAVSFLRTFLRNILLTPKNRTAHCKNEQPQPDSTMGVTGDLLPRILKTAGCKVDLSTYKDGIIDSSEVGDRAKRQRTSSRRPLRIALDVGTIVARAAHGLGSMLVDERHLTNYGRSQLQEEANAADPSAIDPLQAISNDEQKRAYVNRCTSYVMTRIKALQDVSGGELLVVIDGATPPIKGGECLKRSQKRKQAAEERDEPLVADEAAGANTKRRVRAARRAGAGQNHGDILVEVILALRKERIPFMVAPYEADGQLAFLSEKKMVDLVVTEDSDLIAHGCESILYKTIEGLGKGVAEGILVQRESLGAMGMVPKGLTLQDFSDVMIAVMFVALGCDYCSSLKMIGSVAARDIVRIAFHGEKGTSDEERHRPALEKVFERLYRQTSEKNLTEEYKKEYEANFLEALLMFRHPMVYDPLQGKCVLMRNPPQGSDPELMDYEPYARLCNDVRRREQVLGTRHGPPTSTRIAEGWVCPRTKRPYENMEIPSEAREPLSLSASESDADEDAQPNTQEAVARDQSGTTSQDQDTQGPDTQDLDTQDMSLVDRNAPPQRKQSRTVVYSQTFVHRRIGLNINKSLMITGFNDPALVAGGSVMKIGDELVSINGTDIEEGKPSLEVKQFLQSLERPVTLTFSRQVVGDANEDDEVVDEDQGVATQDSQADNSLAQVTHQQSPLTGSSSSRLGSQPSQFSAGSQISPGVHSPNLLR